MTLQELIKEPFAEVLFEAGWRERTKQLVNNGLLLLEDEKHASEALKKAFEQCKNEVLANKWQILSFQMLFDGKPIEIFGNILSNGTFKFDSMIKTEEYFLSQPEQYRIYSVKRLIDDKIFIIGDEMSNGLITEILIDKHFLGGIVIKTDSTSTSIIIA